MIISLNREYVANDVLTTGNYEYDSEWNQEQKKNEENRSACKVHMINKDICISALQVNSTLE